MKKLIATLLLAITACDVQMDGEVDGSSKSLVEASSEEWDVNCYDIGGKSCNVYVGFGPANNFYLTLGRSTSFNDDPLFPSGAFESSLVSRNQKQMLTKQNNPQIKIGSEAFNFQYVPRDTSHSAFYKNERANNLAAAFFSAEASGSPVTVDIKGVGSFSIPTKGFQRRTREAHAALGLDFPKDLRTAGAAKKKDRFPGAPSSTTSSGTSQAVGSNCSDAYFENKISAITAQGRRIEGDGGIGARARGLEYVASAAIDVYSRGQQRCGKDWSSAIQELRGMLATAQEQKRALGI